MDRDVHENNHNFYKYSTYYSYLLKYFKIMKTVERRKRLKENFCVELSFSRKL